MLSKENFRQFVEGRMKQTSSREDLRIEELTLKMFGFVPQDFNLERETVDLVSEQAAAFYDYHRKKLFLTDWAPSAMQESALVHELAHALADQNFHLERFIKQGGKSDDSELARMAVMEGQATWLMTEALARRAGQSISSNPSLLNVMGGGGEGGSSQFPVFNSVPLYLRETLVFPYTDGARFQNAVYDKLGKAAFAELFRHPPDTTQQILHPRKYFDHLEPTAPEFPPVAPAKGFKDLSEGMLGELDHAILIRQYGTSEQADSIAPHWKGGRYRLIENKTRTRVVMQYVSEWDSPEIAKDFFALYAKVLRKKWKKMDVMGEGEGRLSGTGDDGYFLVKQTGSLVCSVEGLASPEQATGSRVIH